MKMFRTCLIALSVLVCFACAGDKKDNTTASKSQDTNEVPANAQEALTQVQKAMEKANLQQGVEPVNYRTLQEFLPEQVAGFERQKLSGAAGFDRQKISGDTTVAVIMKFSKAEGKYRDASNKNLQLDIIDTGGLGMGMMATAAWSTVTIDKEDENGYERTGTFGGYKCFEKFRKYGSNSVLAVVAENRFVVTANCWGCSMETMRSVMQGLDLSKLRGIK